MITGLAEDLQKKEGKKQRQSFFQSVGLGPPPPPPHRQTVRKFPVSAHGYTLAWP